MASVTGMRGRNKGRGRGSRYGGGAGGAMGGFGRDGVARKLFSLCFQPLHLFVNVVHTVELLLKLFV